MSVRRVSASGCAVLIGAAVLAGQGLVWAQGASAVVRPASVSVGLTASVVGDEDRAALAAIAQVAIGTQLIGAVADARRAGVTEDEVLAFLNHGFEDQATQDLRNWQASLKRVTAAYVEWTAAERSEISEALRLVDSGTAEEKAIARDRVVKGYQDLLVDLTAERDWLASDGADATATSASFLRIRGIAEGTTTGLWADVARAAGDLAKSWSAYAAESGAALATVTAELDAARSEASKWIGS